MLLLDERATLLIRRDILSIVKRQLGSIIPNSFDEETFWRNLRSIDDQIDERFLSFYE
jgi:hypothetical protein